MRNCLRIAVSLSVLFGTHASFAQEAAENSWKPTQTIAREKEEGWQEAVLSTVEDIDEFGEDYKVYKDPKAKSTARAAAMMNILARIDRYVDSENVTFKPKATQKVSEILQRTEFRTQKEAPGKSWIERIIERLNEWMKRNRNTSSKSPIEFPNLPWLGGVLQGLMYVILATAIGLLIWLLTKLRLMGEMRKAKARGGGGILEEGEELLSEDEYLLNADNLIAQGRFREACRALYLACLVRLDTARVARLEPTQTNWEHLRRVEANRSKPEGLDFRTPTKLFDHAWYGYTARSAADVEPFRRAYLDIKRLTEVKAA